MFSRIVLITIIFANVTVLYLCLHKFSVSRDETMSGRHVIARVLAPCLTHSPLGLSLPNGLQTGRNCALFPASRTFVSSAILRSPKTPAEESSKRWQLFASVIVERPRILSLPQTEFEEEYRLMVEDFEHAKALKSDHEMRIEQVSGRRNSKWVGGGERG